MHIHLPLVLEAIFFSWIALYWIIYKILLRKKLSPLLASLIANSNYGFMKVLSWSAIITYPFMLFSVNVNIRMYNFDDVQCTVIPSVAYGFVTGMNLQLC